MIRIEMIGNLGADAELKDNNGRKFVSFRLAHTDKWKNSQTGQNNVSTIWASCAINGDAHNILPYLKKGVKVFVRGSVQLNVYSSPKSHQMECGLNIAVWEIELCGGQREADTSGNTSNQAATSAQVQQSATVNTSENNGKTKTKGDKKVQKGDKR